LVERERKVMFDEAWCAPQSNGLEPMWYDARVLAKEAKARNNTAYLLLCYLGNILINFLH
jgi:hypothetical protein